MMDGMMNMSGGGMAGGGMAGGPGSSMGMDNMMQMIQMMNNKLDNLYGTMNMNGAGMGSMNMNGAGMGSMNMNGAATGSMNMNGAGMTNMSGMANSTGGLDITSLLSGLLNFAIAAFAILLVVGVVVGAIVFIKRYLFDGIAAPGKQVCAKCGSTLHSGWNCCPKCGTAKYHPQPLQAQAQAQT